MIIHIDVWLDELKNLHAEFEKACMHNNAFSIERTLYYSALVIRKFSETPFVKRGFLSPVVKGHIFAPARGFVDGLNWVNAESHFDLENGKPETTSLADLCNILIHSRFLDWCPAVGKVEQILVAGGMRAGAEAISFSPSQYVRMLQHVEDYKFKKFPLRTARRAG
jgi:hypothetical protein